MNSIISIMSLLFKQLYSRQGKKDAIRIAAGLVILAVFEIGLIRQAGINESVLGKTYIILALLLMNAYMVFLSVTSQWKESYMKLSCLLPISSRSFWVAQSVVLFVDTCLRRTLFFFILPLFLFGNGTLSGAQTLFWLGRFSFFTVYSIIFGIVLSNYFAKRRTGCFCCMRRYSPVYASASLLCRPPRSRFARFISCGRWSLTFLSFCRRLRSRARCIHFCGDLNFRFTKRMEPIYLF